MNNRPLNIVMASKLCAGNNALPEEELDVDHSRSDFLHHISYEVELVPGTGSM